MAAAWLKAGDQSAVEVEKFSKEMKAKSEARQRMWRFWLEIGEKATITFVDGNLAPNGVLQMVTTREHNLFMGGRWGNHFVCTEGIEPCPICESGDSPSLVGFLTIIDHRKVQSKKDKDKVYTETPRLFAATKDTIKLLQEIAVKRGGLAGARFEVMRLGEKSSRCGTQFDFEEKLDPAVLIKKFTVVKEFEENGKKTKKLVNLFKVADYEKEIPWKSADELRGLGFGSGKKIGGEAPLKDAPDGPSVAEMDSHL